MSYFINFHQDSPLFGDRYVPSLGSCEPLSSGKVLIRLTETMNLYAEVSFDTFVKELGLIKVCLPFFSC